MSNERPDNPTISHEVIDRETGIRYRWDGSGWQRQPTVSVDEAAAMRARMMAPGLQFVDKARPRVEIELTAL